MNLNTIKMPQKERKKERNLKTAGKFYIFYGTVIVFVQQVNKGSRKKIRSNRKVIGCYIRQANVPFRSPPLLSNSSYALRASPSRS